MARAYCALCRPPTFSQQVQAAMATLSSHYSGTAQVRSAVLAAVTGSVPLDRRNALHATIRTEVAH
jgi:hypothetical protein